MADTQSDIQAVWWGPTRGAALRHRMGLYCDRFERACHALQMSKRKILIEKLFAIKYVFGNANQFTCTQK